MNDAEEKTELFNGSQLSAFIKTHDLKESNRSDKELELATSEFLTSYFESSKFYKFNDFKTRFIESLENSIVSGLKEDIRNSIKNAIKTLIVNTLQKFREINKVQVFDGLTWKNDLTLVVKNIMNSSFNIVSNPQNSQLLQNKQEFSSLNAEEHLDEVDIDFNAVFDANLSIETFQETLEKLLNGTELSEDKKKNILRNKVHEFFMQKRKSLHDQ